MEISEIQSVLDELKKRLNHFRGLFDLDAIDESIEINENKMAQPDFGITRKKRKN